MEGFDVCLDGWVGLFVWLADPPPSVSVLFLALALEAVRCIDDASSSRGRYTV